MKPHERLTAAIRSANDAGGPALVPFITAGYPEPADFIGTIAAISEVGDIVEIGIPFSDPMADGMTIQRSSFVALQKGVSLRWIFEQLESTGDSINVPLVMMSYLNPLLAFGYEELAARAVETGVCGFVVPDARPLTRVLRLPSSTSAACTPSALACRMTTLKPTGG